MNLLSSLSNQTNFQNFFKNTNSDIYADIRYIVDTLQNNFNAQCYIVGGAVRDTILGLTPIDYDIECYGIDVETFEHAMNEIEAIGVGKSFFVYKYKSIDISLPRVETKISNGHTGFEVAVTTDEKLASKRRDFTMNALMYDIDNKIILDFWNGIKDINNQVISLVDENSFKEDSLRVLRAMQFSARLGFKIDCKTVTVCKEIDLSDLSKNRVFLEFEKMFKSNFLHYGLYAMMLLDIDVKIFNIKINMKDFMTLSKKFLKYSKNFQPNIKEYYFPYIFTQYFNNRDYFLDTLNAPNIYYKQVDNESISQVISVKFLLNRALQKPLIDDVINFNDEVIVLSKELSVWNHKFDAQVDVKALMEEGFNGKDIGDELNRRIQRKIGIISQQMRAGSLHVKKS